MRNLPIITNRDKNLSLSVFYKENYYSVCVQRSYKKEGTTEWMRESINMFPDDLLKLAEIARRTYSNIQQHRSKNKPVQPQQQDTGYYADQAGQEQFYDDAIPF